MADDDDDREKLARLEFELLPNEFRGITRPKPWRSRRPQRHPATPAALAALGIRWWDSDEWKAST